MRLTQAQETQNSSKNVSAHRGMKILSSGGPETIFFQVSLNCFYNEGEKPFVRKPFQQLFKKKSKEFRALPSSFFVIPEIGAKRRMI